MKTTFFLLGVGAGIAVFGPAVPHALERTAGIPTASVAVAVAIPTCGANQFLTASDNRLRCSNFPVCAAGEVLTSTGGGPNCVAIAQGQVGAVTVVPLNDATTVQIGSGFNTSIWRVETGSCPADHTLISCSGGTMNYGSSTGTEFEAEIIAPIMAVGDQRCRMTYERRNGAGLELRELYAYCQRAL